MTVKYNYGMADKDVEAGIMSISKRHKSLYGDIQMLSVSIIAALHKSGDGETATKRANALITALANGKQNSLRRWFETQCNMVYNKETKQLVIGHSASSPVKHHSKINALESRGVNWFDAIPETEYKAIADWTGQIAALVKKGQKDIAELGDKSKVNKAHIMALEQMLTANTLAA